MDENIQARFDEKVKELLSAAKKKKNVLEYQEYHQEYASLRFCQLLFELFSSQLKLYNQTIFH